jgi:endoglucanase
LTAFMPPEYDTTGVVFPGPPASPIGPGAGANSVTWVTDWFRKYNKEPADINPNGPAAVLAEFEFARAFAERTKRSLYMGEFGVGDKADPASRAAWLHMVRTEAEKRGIGWAYWDDGASFAMYDDKSRSWNESLKGALLGP